MFNFNIGSIERTGEDSHEEVYYCYGSQLTARNRKLSVRELKEPAYPEEPVSEGDLHLFQ